MPLPRLEPLARRLLAAALLAGCLSGCVAGAASAADSTTTPATSVASASASAPASAPPAGTLTREQVDLEAQALRSLPGLTGVRKDRSLRLKLDPTEPPKPQDTPEWVRWLQDFAEWFNDVGRWLVWGLLALAVALLALRLRRYLKGGAGRSGSERLNLPTQVRGLDISPESLPDDIGAAAWALWQGGQLLEALSLLYRGALSMLVHRHQVPIRSSSTEGDCLDLATPRLAAPALRYLQALVGTWRQAVYAARWPAEAEVQGLCQGFGALMSAGSGGPNSTPGVRPGRNEAGATA